MSLTTLFVVGYVASKLENKKSVVTNAAIWFVLHAKVTNVKSAIKKKNGFKSREMPVLFLLETTYKSRHIPMPLSPDFPSLYQ
jgi:hypothetical protein